MPCVQESSRARKGKQMRNKKALVFIILSVLLLGGCNDAEMGEQQVVLETERKEEIKLSLFAPVDVKSTGSLIYRQPIKEFNEEQDEIQVTFEGISTKDGFNSFLEERLDAGEGDDIFIVNADTVKPLFQKGYFYDLSGLEVYGRLNDAARSQSTIDGIAYCLPANLTAYSMYVNRKVLKKYGLEVPENYEEFMTCLEVLSENGETPISLNRWGAMVVPAMARGLYPLYESLQRDELIQKLNSGELLIGEYMLEGFRMFEDFVRSGYYGEGLTGEYVDSLKANTKDIEDFKAGKTAFFFQAVDFNVIEDINTTAPEVDLIVCGIPVLPEGAVVIPSATVRLCVNANGHHLDESLKFVNEITVRIMEQYEEEGGMILPVLKDVDVKVMYPEYKPVFELAKQGKQIPIEDMSLHFTYWDTIRELCLGIIDGDSAQEAAEKYNQIQLEKIGK